MARIALIGIGIVAIAVGAALSVLLLPLGYSIGLVLIVAGVIFLWGGFRGRVPRKPQEGESPRGSSP